MNPIKTHIAIVLLPVLVAACAADGPTDDAASAFGLDGWDGSEGVGGSGGGDEAELEADAMNVAGSAQPAREIQGQSLVLAGGAGGAGGGGDATTGAGAGDEGSTTGAGGDDATTATGAGGAGGDAGTTTGTGDGSTSGAGGEGGAGEGGAGGGEGGAAPDLSDTCPGEAHAIALGGPAVTITGSTVDATDALDTCWSTDPTTDGKDRVYAFELPEAGVLTVDLSGEGAFRPALVVRSTCDEDEYCHHEGGKHQIHRSFREAGTVYVIVDGQGADEGNFTLTATLTTPRCGDGVITGTEECDGGDANAFDGCGDPGASDQCMHETPADATGESCADPIALAVPETGLVLSGQQRTTQGFEDDSIGNCMPATGGPDLVYQVTPAVSGTIEVRAGFIDDGSESVCSAAPESSGCFDIELYARATCDDAGSEVACASNCCDGETVQLQVEAGVPVFLFVDGYDAEWYSQGPFNLHFTYTAITPEG
jgi:hypothetical protein